MQGITLPPPSLCLRNLIAYPEVLKAIPDSSSSCHIVRTTPLALVQILVHAFEGFPEGEVADTVAGGDTGALGRMIVVAQEVAVSTTHLFVASRVKADPNSSNLINLQMASREVSKATGTLVAGVKNAIDACEAEDLDFSCLTLTQAKRMEMESQVRVLHLESELVNERRRLAQLRRENYQDSADVEASIFVPPQNPHYLMHNLIAKA
ncbi:unnamed protein product [Echinostoma caproni]|uniref:I/LWEQ domain-containing protein n=1 Tax=Echinostoma caproni TaxID=27848 RepID=A0A183AWA4_9TREM|nr:unnamed protein product [Echinostoma caproni]